MVEKRDAGPDGRRALNRDRMYEGEDRYPDRDDGSRHREDEWRDRADWSAGEGRFYRNPAGAVPDDYDRERDYQSREPYSRNFEDRSRISGRDFDDVRHYDRDYDRGHWGSPVRREPEERQVGREIDRDRNLDHFRGGYRDEDDYWRRERETMRERDLQRRETLDSIRSRREPWR